MVCQDCSEQDGEDSSENEEDDTEEEEEETDEEEEMCLPGMDGKEEVSVPLFGWIQININTDVRKKFSKLHTPSWMQTLYFQA